jgi:hypothetical protein
VYHTIELRVKFLAELEPPPEHPAEPLLIRRGTRIRLRLKPYVSESSEGPIEVADLFFENGEVTRRVPFACFSFVE